MNAKNKEIAHLKHFISGCSKNDEVDDGIDLIPNPASDSFIEQFIWENSVENFEKTIPKLIGFLTSREQQVFKLIRDDRCNGDISEILNLSKPRVSALTRQVEQKLKQACKDLGLIE